MTLIHLLPGPTNTLTDFRIDLAQYPKAHPGVLETLPPGAFAVTTASEAEIAPGIILCLRAEGGSPRPTTDGGYPLAPHYLVHVGEDGAVVLPYNSRVGEAPSR